MKTRQGFIWDEAYHNNFEGETHWAAYLKFEQFLSKDEFWAIFEKQTFSFDHVISTQDFTACTAKSDANFKQAITHNIWQTGGVHLKNGFAKQIVIKNKKAKKNEPFAAMFTVKEQWQTIVPSWKSIQSKLEATPQPTTTTETTSENTNNEKEEKILKNMRNIPWEQFEHFTTQKVSKLLNGTLVTTKPRGDGGKDSEGTIELALGVILPVCIQTKQQKANVDGDTVAAFCHRVPLGSIGLFITTSDYTPQARIEAENARTAGKNIYLISGKEFAKGIVPITEFTTVEQEIII